MKLKPIPSQYGIIGVAVYWLEWALDIVPLAFAAYSIYLCTLLALQYWTKVNGYGALICSVFAIVFAIGSVVLNILTQFSFIETLQKKLEYAHYGCTIVGLIIHAVLLSFFTPIAYVRSSTDFYEHTMDNYKTDSVARHYYNLYTSDPYEVRKIIWDRTITQKIPLTSFFILWGICFSIYFLGSNYTECHDPKSPSHHQNTQYVNQGHSDLEPLRQVPENENDDVQDNNEEETNEQ